MVVRRAQRIGEGLQLLVSADELDRVDFRTTVPVHGNRTLKIGTLRSILRDINLSPTEFEQLWNA